MKITFESKTTTLIKAFAVEYVQDVDILEVYNDFVKINELKETTGVMHVKETDMKGDILISNPDFIAQSKASVYPLVSKVPGFVDEEIEECTALPAPPGLDEIDAMGVKWDPKIHAKAKTKNKNGTWRLGNNRELPNPPSNNTETENYTIHTVHEPISPETTIPENSDEPTLNDLMALINTKIIKKLLTHAQLFEILKSLGLSSHIQAAGKPDLISQIILSIELTAPEI